MIDLFLALFLGMALLSTNNNKSETSSEVNSGFSNEYVLTRNLCEDKIPKITDLKPTQIFSKEPVLLKKTDISNEYIPTRNLRDKIPKITDLKPVKVLSKDYVLLKKTDGTWTYYNMQ
jgi:hypothetical protein